MLYKNPWSKLSLVEYKIQYSAKFGEKSGIFCFHNFFRAERVLGLDPNYVIGIVNCEEKIVSPISNSYTLRKMAGIQYVGHAILETTRFPQNSVFRRFRGR